MDVEGGLTGMTQGCVSGLVETGCAVVADLAGVCALGAQIVNVHKLEMIDL